MIDHNPSSPQGAVCGSEIPQPIDASMKALLRGFPGALFRLAGQCIDPTRLRMEDTAINLSELRADHVYLVADAEREDTGAVYVEYQLQPRPELLAAWFTKAGALQRQLGLPVVLVAVYLVRGDRSTFPSEYGVEVAGFSTRYEFTALRLWEHVDRIRSGELWELAPLLILCENNPSEATLREEVAIITRATANPSERAELFAVALRVAGRRFTRAAVEAVFREELPMVQGATIIDDWIAEGEARGEVRGEARGRVVETREAILENLTLRHGSVPEEVAATLQAITDLDRLRALRRVSVTTSLPEFMHHLGT